MLRLQVLLYPNLDATTSKPSWKEWGTGTYLVSQAEMIERYDAYLAQGINRKEPKVSPLFATDLTEIAPALIITADHDPLHDVGRGVCGQVEGGKCRCGLHLLAGHRSWPCIVG